MKKLFLTLAVLLSVATLSAQDYREAGPMCKVELTGGANGYACVGASFAYGYRFDSHLSVGAGLGGFFVEFPYVPVYSFARWDFSNAKTTPFVEVQLGAAYDVNESVARLYCSPTVGVAIGRFSISAGVMAFGYDDIGYGAVGYIAKIGWTF